jgi:antitoxin component of MazEF toxin-antitoxin module
MLMAEKVLQRKNVTLVPIPKRVVEDVGIHPGSYVEVTDDGYRIIITPKVHAKEEEFTEEELNKIEKLAKEKGGKSFKSGEAFLKYLEKISKKMKFYSSPSFLRCFKKLDSLRKQKVREAIKDLIELYNTGLNPKGLGFKRLRKNLWEIRSSLKDRILFTISDEVITFVVVGNHDEIRRYLKSL